MNKKSLNVFWSPLAEKSYLETIEFILGKWTIKEADSFTEQVKDLIAKIQTFNNLCPPTSKFKYLRKCVVSFQTSLVYRIRKDNIEIIAFFDNRSGKCI
ncbi:MAG: type II toxin-antitoxin system RelE/ParE family toxin [Bacteroidota bacterium]